MRIMAEQIRPGVGETAAKDAMGKFLLRETINGHRVSTPSIPPGRSDAEIDILLSETSREENTSVILGIGILTEAEAWEKSCLKCRRPGQEIELDSKGQLVFDGLTEEAVIRLLRTASLL